jgi:PAS domain S-box-containing protein
MCAGWWTPHTGCYACFFAETSPVEASRRAAVASCQRLELAFEHLPVMVAYHGPGAFGECLFANRRYAELFGLDPLAIVGMSARRILGNARMRDVLRDARPLFERGVAVVQSCDLRRQDGTWMRLEVSLVPGMERERGHEGTFVLVMDITERHTAETELRESEVRLSKFMQATAEGLVFHEDGIVTDINPVACEMLGRTSEQIKGRTFVDFLSPEHRSSVEAVLRQQGGGACESELMNAHGERIAVEVTGRTMLRNGERLRMVVLRDIRDRLQAQARIDELIAGLRAEKDRAQAADRAKSVFLAAASHDLRQPLHALGLFLTALRSMAHNPMRSSHELADIGQRMQSSLDSLGQLLNMLLDVSRLDANAVQVEREPTSLGPLLHDLGQDFLALASEKKLRLRVAPSHLWVDTDPTVLRRILTNLLSNAVRYTPRGRILLGCRRRGGEVEIQVWDSGIGIAPEQREAIFEEFFQIGQSAAQDHEAHGLGLGLSIVRRSARLLQAPLDLRSLPGRGSMFSIRLPLCQAPARLPTFAAPSRRTTTSLGVLVIDDEPQVLSAMQHTLEAWGHRAFCASSADEAVVTAITHAEHIHLLLSDYRLSGNVTAVDAISAVHACLPHPVPTYILTGDTSPQRIREASLLGFPLLHKPVNAQTLRNILDTEAIAHSTLA